MAFFVELGMELEGEAPIEGPWVDRLNGLDGVRVDIAMMRTPDGHGRLELTKFHAPTAVSPEPRNALGNTLGLRSVMFAVDDVDADGRRPAGPRRRARRRGGAVRGQLPALLRPRPRGDHRRAGRAARLAVRSGAERACVHSARWAWDRGCWSGSAFAWTARAASSSRSTAPTWWSRAT